MSSTFVYRPDHPEADELGFIPKELDHYIGSNSKSPQVMGDIKPFKSPIDGTIISSRSQLRNYEKKHGVKQVGNDWSGRERPSWWDNRKEIARTGKAE